MPFPLTFAASWYATNASEALHPKLCRAAGGRGDFHIGEAVLKLLFLVLNLAMKE